MGKPTSFSVARFYTFYYAFSFVLKKLILKRKKYGNDLSKAIKLLLYYALSPYKYAFF